MLFLILYYYAEAFTLPFVAQDITHGFVSLVVMGVYLSDNQELDPSFRRNPWNIEAVNSLALAVLWVVAVGLTPSTRQRPPRPGCPCQ